MESSRDVWEMLVRTHRDVVTTAELTKWARALDRPPSNVVRHLRRGRYIEPLFKGFYYVHSPEERALKSPRWNPLELFTLAANAKGIGTWYFALHTALRANGMTHEDRRQEQVVNSTLYRIGGVSLGNRRFIIHKWAPALLTFGLREKPPYRYSDPEKTVLDLAYLDAWRQNRGRPPSHEWADHIETVDRRKLVRYLRRYPPGVRALLEASL